ncbi:hypothetical protein ACFL3S_08920 [Gemmatimonadota bacterium]
MSTRTDSRLFSDSTASREQAADTVLLSVGEGRQEGDLVDDSSESEEGHVILIQVKASGDAVFTFEYDSEQVKRRIVRTQIRKLLKK